jgi:hypothetical protein
MLRNRCIFLDLPERVDETSKNHSSRSLDIVVETESGVLVFAEKLKCMLSRPVLKLNQEIWISLIKSIQSAVDSSIKLEL